MTDLFQPSLRHDLSYGHDISCPNDSAALQTRALRRHERYLRSTRRAMTFHHMMTGYARRLVGERRALPARYALHLLVGLLIPLACFASRAPLDIPLVLIPPTIESSSVTFDLVVPPAPLTQQPAAAGDLPVPDSEFAAIDALPISQLRPELLGPQPIRAKVVAESAKVRSGPGSHYDKVGELPAGTQLQILAQAEGWYQARAGDHRIIWIAAELLDLDSAGADIVPQALNIPAPPPAKIGLVAVERLELRDGPGTAYVGMAKLNASVQLDLLARYGDWFQVQTPEGQTGWVLGQHLTIGPGVVERVEGVTSIPDATPALVGRTSDRRVNLRGGPGTAYDKIGALAAGTQLDLLGQYKSWLKVRTSQGTIGWVSNELLDVSPFVARRVPAVHKIPALAPRKPVSQAAPPRRAIPAPSAAAGNVIAYAVQFVGARYAWGGSGPDAFDCSGFTRYVYKQFGLNLPHSAAAQYSTSYGTMISNPADLRPGDIVFFVNTYKRGISHVGIYAGDGAVVQAISPKQGVAIASMNGGYWAQHYYGAIRPAR